MPKATWRHSSQRTSASSTTRFPSGQMTWSTWERTRSQVSSGVRRLVCRGRRKRLQSLWEDHRADTAGRHTHHIDFRVGVAHVAHNAAVFHPIQVFSGHNVLVSCDRAQMNPRQGQYKPSNFSFPALGSEKPSLRQHQVDVNQDKHPPGRPQKNISSSQGLGKSTIKQQTGLREKTLPTE